jgi:hypothetical protein
MRRRSYAFLSRINAQCTLTSLTDALLCSMVLRIFRATLPDKKAALTDTCVTELRVTIHSYSSSPAVAVGCIDGRWLELCAPFHLSSDRSLEVYNATRMQRMGSRLVSVTNREC